MKMMNGEGASLTAPGNVSAFASIPTAIELSRWELTRVRERALVLVWVLLVYPFTLLGYGADGDAWLVARTAENIWSKHEYIASRTTGFPLFELAVTPAVHFGGWYLSNVMLMIAGIALMLALFRLGRGGFLKRPVLVVLGVMFIPVMVKSCSVTMDYVMALAAMTWAYAFLREGRLVACGLLIGLACGFRPSSGLFAAPCAFYVLLQRRSLAEAIKLGIIAFVSGVVAYSPALIKYGIRTPMSGIKLDAKTLALIGGYNFTQVFGIIGTIALGAAIGLSAFRLWKSSGRGFFTPEIALHVANIVMWLLFFTLIPEEPEYLLPMLPSVILLLDTIVPERMAVIVTALLLLQHVIVFDVLGGTSGDRHFDPGIRAGSTISDVQFRRFQLSTRSAATAYHANVPTVLMVGYSWIPARNPAWVWDDKYDLARQREGKLFVASVIRDKAMLQRLHADGFRLVVWNNAKWQYTRTGNTDWKDYVEVVDNLDTFFGSHIVGHTPH